MRLVFFGDGYWATKCLQGLLDGGHSVLAVIGRRSPTDQTLLELASLNGIDARRPLDVNAPEFVEWIRRLRPELNVSMSFDQILHRSIIESAPKGFINSHAGNLPRYRGRNVINWAIINNETEIGLTIHYVDEGIDTGDVILQRTLSIGWQDTYGDVLLKVQEALPKILAEAVGLIEKGEAPREVQVESSSTYFSKRLQGDEWIDWHDSSLDIYNKIRAITRPGPGARTIVGNRVLIIWGAHYDLRWPKYVANPGEVVGVVPGGVRVKTGDSTLVLQRVQFEGEEMNERCPDFRIGTRFGTDLVEAVCQLRQEVAELRQMIKTLRVTEDPCS